MRSRQTFNTLFIYTTTTAGAVDEAGLLANRSASVAEPTVKASWRTHCVGWRTAVDDVLERQDAAPANVPQITSQKLQSPVLPWNNFQKQSNFSEETRLRQTWRKL